MIINALSSYFDRAREAGHLPPLGWMDLPLDYVLVVDKNGDPVTLMPRFELDGKKKVRKNAVLPAIGKQAIKHTNAGDDPNLMWDNAGFALGLIEKDASDKEKSKALKRIGSFMDLFSRAMANVNDPAIAAISEFYKKIDRHQDWFKNTAIQKTETLTFRLNSDTRLAIEKPPIIDAVNSYIEVSGDTFGGICMVTGDKASARS